MNLYIFEPSKDWEYCGGAIVAIAADVEAVVQLIVAKQEQGEYDHFYISDFVSEESQAHAACKQHYILDEQDVEFFDKYPHGSFVWVLHHTIPVADTEQPRVLTVNFNEA
jgi:hypothetical protein